MRPILALALAAGFALPAHAESMSVALDETQLATFPADIAAISVGNPAIVGLTPLDTRHYFILGKAYGATNILAVNKAGQTVANLHVNVLNGQQATVRLQRGTERVTYNCVANHCEVSPQPGDGKTADAIAGQISAHQDAAMKAASPQSN